MIINQTALLGELQRNIMRSVVQVTEEVRNEAVRLITHGQRTGRVYHHHGHSHRASAPGEPPASDTGNLVNSIHTEYDAATLTGRVVVGAEYGLYLEYGTQHMEARPFMRRALASKEAEINQLVQKAAAQVIDRYRG